MCCIATMVTARLPMPPRKRVSVTVATAWAVFSGIMTTTGSGSLCHELCANVLYRNNGDGTFTDVTEEAGVGDGRWGTGAAFGDYDNDGIWISMFLTILSTDPRPLRTPLGGRLPAFPRDRTRGEIGKLGTGETADLLHLA